VVRRGTYQRKPVQRVKPAVASRLAMSKPALSLARLGAAKEGVTTRAKQSAKDVEKCIAQMSS